MQVYCEGRRSYNRSFRIDIRVVKSETSRYTVITKAKLKPGTAFKVYVTAFTVKGEGATSDAVNVNTPSKGKGKRCLFYYNYVLVYLSRSQTIYYPRVLKQLDCN